MALNDFRSIYLSYCIEQNTDGSWVVLNRQYKPVGFNTSTFIDYSAFPVQTKLKGLGPATLAKLSYSGEVTGNRVYLYNDGTNPINSDADMKAYLKKIEILAKKEVDNER